MQRLRPFPEVLAEARSHGFACFATMQPPATDFHLIEQLSKFKIASYKGASLVTFRAKAGQRQLGKWWGHLGHTLGNRGLLDGKAVVVQVCYHGNFAVRMDKIKAVNSSLWPLLVASFQHGGSIEGATMRSARGLAYFPIGPSSIFEDVREQPIFAGRMCTKS